MTIKFSDITGGGIPYGNNAGRPANPGIGKLYSNGELQRLELYTGATYGWQNIVAETPGVTGYTGTIYENTGGNITIVGTNFASGAVATLIGTDGTEYIATTTTVNNLTNITAAFGPVSGSKEPYDIKITNPSNLYGVYYDILTINDAPVWATAAGLLGTFNEQTSISLTVSATDEENNTITYSVASGSSLPSGITLNSSTGIISGTLPNISADTTYTFVINASDGTNITSRTFSIASKLAITTEFLVIAGGGSGATSIGGGGGAGGMREGSLQMSKSSLYDISIGAGGASPGLSASYNLRGNKGGNSRFASIYATGGGGGGQHTTSNTGTGGYTDLQGGSGGGGARHTPGGGGGAGGPGGNATGGSQIFQYGGYGNEGGYSPVEGYPGGYGIESYGSGHNCGDGGVGRQSSITGVATYYAGGGGGGGYQSSNGGGAGGLGGGGRGRDGQSGDNATGHGSGGGGAGYPGTVNGGAGSGGLVVLAYPISDPALTISGGLTYTLDTTTRSGYRVYKFTAGAGTVTF